LSTRAHHTPIWTVDVGVRADVDDTRNSQFFVRNERDRSSTTSCRSAGNDQLDIGGNDNAAVTDDADAGCSGLLDDAPGTIRIKVWIERSRRRDGQALV